ncbi:MAG: cation acetate symporter [Chloroflexi bacterium]|nr:cation acetate symporter [Chloroflexota bacterium]
MFQDKLFKYYGLFTIGFILFSILMLILELVVGVPTGIIGWAFLLLTMGLYATVGIISRTKVLDEYYVAGRRVPGFFNGMATGADWMSAASFISMAGSLWLLGYDGLAYIMGWTGGYVLLALLFAPYIRKFGQYTIPDFVGARFGGNKPRAVAAFAAVIVSFTYVTAQVTGVGLIMSRFVGVPYEWGVIIGLSGVLVCSFLGGMKAVTWTQVAQYVILIVAYLVPVTFLSVKLTGFPIPELAYGQALQNIQRLEVEQKISKGYITPFNESLSNASAVAATKQINSMTGANIAEPIPAVVSDWTKSPWDFMALTLVLMIGTAGLPHILIRFYTVPSIRESRKSVGWALFFIFLLYFTAPAYASFSRWEMLKNVAGLKIGTVQDGGKTYTTVLGNDGKPLSWVLNFGKTGLLTINDANKDGVLQFTELNIVADLIVLSTPEIAGLPYTIAALVAAGGLAAALSTADGLLVVIASAVAHDWYYRIYNPKASAGRRMALGKAMVVVAAAAAALAAMPRLALIVQMVSWAFSLAAASFFPIVLLGIFWKRANGVGASFGIISGLAVTLIYMVGNYTNPAFNILGISHLSAGLFGAIANFTVTIGLSLVTAAPPKEIQELVEHLRHPQEDDALMDDLAGGKVIQPLPAPAPASN